MKIPKFDGDFDAGDINLDLTPLIDVIFVLLIFFILTTTFAKPLLDVVLPQSNQATPNKDKQFLNIVINDKGVLYYENNEISLDDLRVLLKEKTETLNIMAHKDMNFGRFVEVLDIAKELRNGEFVISTEGKSEGINNKESESSDNLSNIPSTSNNDGGNLIENNNSLPNSQSQSVTSESSK